MTDDHRAALRDYMTAREAYVKALSDYRDAYPPLREASNAVGAHLGKFVAPWRHGEWQLALERLEQTVREAKRSYRDSSEACSRAEKTFHRAVGQYNRALPMKS